MSTDYTSEDTADHDGIAAVIKNDAGEILMQEHVKYGFWTIPVGKVKNGQDVEEGLREEVFEECNLEIQESTKLCTKEYLYERNGKMVKVISHLYEVLKHSGEMKNMEPHKHKQQLFLSIPKILELPYLSDGTLLYLSHIGIDRPAYL